MDLRGLMAGLSRHSFVEAWPYTKDRGVNVPSSAVAMDVVYGSWLLLSKWKWAAKKERLCWSRALYLRRLGGMAVHKPVTVLCTARIHHAEIHLLTVLNNKLSIGKGCGKASAL